MRNMYPPPARTHHKTCSLTRFTIHYIVVLSLLGLLTVLATPAFAQPWYGQCAQSEGCDTTFSHDSASWDLGWWITDCTSTPPSTGKCVVTVWRGSRACNGRCELFIDSIRIDSASECGCDAPSFFEAVISLTILNMPEQINGVLCMPPYDSCTTVVRVHMASCMTNDYGMLLPCIGADCCFVDYQVCKNPYGSPRVFPIYITTPPPPCLDEGEIPLTVNPPGYGCYPTCPLMTW